MLSTLLLLLQYLYETFPEVISPLYGVNDERFMVWMRVAGLRQFRKPYGKVCTHFKHNFNMPSQSLVYVIKSHARCKYGVRRCLCGNNQVGNGCALLTMAPMFHALQ
jgi:hypothetical protein